MKLKQIVSSIGLVRSVIYDEDGSKVAPDVISGADIGKWPQEYLAHQYNKRLASSNSARSGTHHNAPGCLHYTFLHACWMLDPKEYPQLYPMVDVTDHRECTNRQTVVLMAKEPNQCPLFLGVNCTLLGTRNMSYLQTNCFANVLPTPQLSTHQRFGPPILDNWLPDSSAACHYTPIFSNLCNDEPCHIPVSIADGTTKISAFKGTTDCYFHH